MSLENEIIGVDHLGILTGDLKRDVAWYEEKLGFEKIQQRIVVMNGRTEIALLKKENLVLELVEPAGRLKDEAAHLSNGKWDHFASFLFFMLLFFWKSDNRAEPRRQRRRSYFRW